MSGTGGEAAPARWRDLAGPVLGPRAALVLLGIWLNAADGMVAATIMPSVARDLGGVAYFGWAVAGYLLGSILAGASAGQLSRRLGLKPAMILAAAIYAAGCLLSAVGGDMTSFLIGRAVQGIGSGWIVGFCYIAIGVVFPEPLWSRLFGAGAGVWGVAALLGPLVGGLFAAAGAWRGVFWMFAGQGLLFAAAAAWLLPRRASGGGEVQHSLDQRPLAWRTLGVLALAIGAIAVADITPGRWTPVALVCVGLALLVVAGEVNARPAERLLPRDAVRPLTVAGAGYAMIFAMCGATAVINVYEAAILQAAYGLSPLAAGYVIAVEALGWTATAFVVSGAPERRHGAFIVAGASLIVAGLALLALAIASGRIWWIVAAGAIEGGGFGLAWSLAARAIMVALPDEDRAIGASAVPTAQLIGGAAGAAGAGAMANLLGLANAFTAERALAAAPWLFAAFLPVAGLGWLAALRLGRAADGPARLT